MNMGNVFSPTSRVGLWLLGYVKGYHHNKYWQRRKQVIDPNSRVPLIIKLYYIIYGI